MWLRRRDRIAVETNLEEGCYDHPVVILSPRPRDGNVVMLMVSTYLTFHQLQTNGEIKH
jgi:hypothetical protein